MRHTFVFAVLALAVLALSVGAGFLWGDKRALDTLSIVQVTPNQMAEAMSADNFYGLWRERTLVAHGTVAGITQQGSETLIELTTDSVSKVYCDMSSTTTLAAGDSVRVVAEGERANRMPSGVLLTGCVVL